MTARNWFIVVAAYCSILLGAWASTHIETDFSLTTLSARSSPDYQNYQTYAKRFPISDDGLVVSIGNDAKFDSHESFLSVEELRLDLLKIKGVESALGITSVELPERSLFGAKSRLLLNLQDKNQFEKQLSKINNFTDVAPKFLSDDRTATRIFLTVDWSKVSLAKIQNTVEKYAFSEVHFMGKEVFSSELKQSLESEIVLLPLMAGAVLLLLFFIWFRDVRSLVIVASVLAINLSLLSVVFYAGGIKIGLLTSTTPLLILVLSFSDIVHILYKYKRLNAGSIQERIFEMMKPLRLPLWLTTLTTALAFGLFFVTGISEIAEFAFATCVGILLAYLTARYLIPLLLLMYRVRPFKKKSAFSSSAEWLIRLLQVRRSVIIVSSIVLIFISVSVIAFFKINISYHQSFGADTAIGKALRFSDAHFEGVRTIEVILESKQGLNPQTISKVDLIEKELSQNYGCRSVFSVNTAIKRLNRYNHFGKASQFTLPTEFDQKFLSDLRKNRKELGLINAMTDDEKLYRIVGRLPDIGSAKSAIKNQYLQGKINQLKDANHEIFISGFSFVKDQSTTRVTSLILLGVALSLIVATCVIGVAFRSFKIALISFFPNFLPVLFGLALMNWLGIELNPTTAMALSIILGLALDDTIYFLSSIKRSNDVKPSESIEFSLRENTFPAAVTSIILMIGFGILILSSIESNRNIGILVATMLLIALISDLVILPALLRIFWNKKNLI